MSHAQGGREGGPNYFLQAPRVNRRLSPLGRTILIRCRERGPGWARAVLFVHRVVIVQQAVWMRVMPGGSG